MITIFKIKIKTKTHIYDSCLKRRTIDSCGKSNGPQRGKQLSRMQLYNFIQLR